MDLIFLFKNTDVKTENAFKHLYYDKSILINYDKYNVGWLINLPVWKS